MSITDRLQCDARTDWVNDFSQCLFEWQGLEGGILALAAAALSICFLRRQISQSQTHRDDDIRRKHNAAKLTMPLALSAVSELAQVIANDIADELESYDADGEGRTLDAILSDRVVRKRFDPRALPDSVIASFEKFVESLSEPADIKHVSELIASIQILISRLNDLNLQGAGAKLNLESLLLDAATVKLLADSMFNYARNVDQGPFGIVGIISDASAWDQIQGSAQSLVFGRKSPDFFFPAINEKVTQYKKASVSPWIEKFS